MDKNFLLPYLRSILLYPLFLREASSSSPFHGSLQRIFCLHPPRSNTLTAVKSNISVNLNLNSVIEAKLKVVAAAELHNTEH